MSTLLDQLIQEQGEEVAGRISEALGISREDAAGVLPATASVILDRFEPGTCEIGGTDPDPRQPDGDPERSLDGILGGTGEQLSERAGTRLGIAPEQAAQVIPLLVPVILRFLLKRVPYSSTAVSVLSSTVAKQGHGSLDALAIRLANRAVTGSTIPGQPGPSIATRLGRWAGKWFPSSED